MSVLGIPVWLFAGCMICSLFVGLTLRWWMDARKRRQELAFRERVKELKKQRKHQIKKEKKSGKR